MTVNKILHSRHSQLLGTSSISTTFAKIHYLWSWQRQYHCLEIIIKKTRVMQQEPRSHKRKSSVAQLSNCDETWMILSSLSYPCWQGPAITSSVVLQWHLGVILNLHTFSPRPLPLTLLAINGGTSQLRDEQFDLELAPTSDKLSKICVWPSASVCSWSGHKLSITSTTSPWPSLSSALSSSSSSGDAVARPSPWDLSARARRVSWKTGKQ